jgi:hypothetical protein
MEKVTFISVKLANKAYIHLFIASELTTKSTMEPYIETDLFTYNTATAIASRYTLTVFMGIMIDTGALYKSIAGYSQF